MQNTSTLSIIINAALFQIVWFASVMGGAKQVLWPCLLSFALLAVWQLHPNRRHATDIKLLIAAIALGLFFDSLWVQLGFLEYVDTRPIATLAPIWIIVLWMGFALTINHSLTWMNKHPALPIVLGGVCGPMSYLAGQKLEAVSYQANVALVSGCLAVAWAFSLWVLTWIAQKTAPKLNIETAAV